MRADELKPECDIDEPRSFRVVRWEGGSGEGMHVGLRTAELMEQAWDGGDWWLLNSVSFWKL